MAYIGNTVQTVLRTSTFITATASQTVFNIPSGYNLNAIDVFVNGFKLIQNTDYTANDGVAVTMLSGLALNDEVEVVVYGDYQLQNTERQIPRSRKIHVFIVDSNQNTTYTIPGGYWPNTLDVFLNGVRLINVTDYDETSGTDITLTNTPNENDELHVVVYSSFTLANAVAKTGDTLQGTLTTQNLLPDVTLTRDIGSNTLRYNEIYLAGNTIHLGDRQLSAENVPNVNLTIAPEVLEIQVDDPTAGHGTAWLWTWLTSSLPYARTTITNQPQTIVPLYKQGTYVINNFAFTAHGDMTQGHDLKIKWVEGAGNDNLVEWINYSTVTHSHPDINDGNPISVRRLSFQVPATITPPTLTAPTVDYYIENSGFSSWYFTHDPSNMMVTGSNHGENPILGPWYRGGTYNLHVDASGHPLYLTTDNGSNYVSGTYFGEYTDGVTNSRTASGTLSITVPEDAPDTLYYQCGNHSSMRGSIRVQDLAVETNINGNFIVYAQHSQERHAQKIELRPIPALVNQMCLVYEENSGTFVPQDLATYVENTPSFKNKIQEVAGTAELVVEDGSAVIAKVNVYYGDATYLPLLGNNAGDQAFVTDTNVLYIWDGSEWQQAGSTNADDLVEGSNNLFYTDDRVDARLASGSVGNVTIAGNLQVNGTTTTINSTELAIDDINITLANGSVNKTNANGAGLTVDLGSDGNAILSYNSNNDKFEMNKSLVANITGQISDISNHNTDTLNEGVANLYYTTARSNADFDTRYATKLGSSQKLITAGDNFTAGDVVIYDNGSYVKPLLASSGFSSPVTPSNGLSVSGVAATIIYDQVNDRYAIFRRSGSALFANVAQATPTGFTFGADLQFHNAHMNDCALAIDKSTNKIICAWVGGGASYADGGMRVAAFEIDPTTNTITMGNVASDLDNPNVGYISIGYDTDTGKFLVIYGAYQDMRCNAGYVDGQNIVLGARQNLTASGGPTWTGVAYDQTAQRFFVGHSANGRVAAVAQINSDNSITFGSWTTIPCNNNPGYPYYKKSEGKVYIPYTSTTYAAALGEVTIDNVANTLTFNSLTLAPNNGNGWSIDMAYSELYDQFYYYYRNYANSTEYIADVIFTNGTPSLANITVISNMFNFPYGTQYKNAVGSDRVIGVYGTGPAYLVFCTFTSINSNTSSWIGIAAENISSGNTGKVDMPGAINKNQTGLTTNSVYYVSATGALTTTPTSNGKIGRALSATELQIADIHTHNTDNLAEGSTNLYYSDDKVDARLASGNVGDVTIAGNLQVNGTTTTINTTNLTIEDKNIEISKGAADGAASDGAGITVDLGTDGSATITYSDSNDRWEMNKSLATTFVGNITGQVSDISNHDTDDLAEGTNLYYTDSRADARVNLQTGANLDLSQKTTTNLAEGTNLYYTDSRADARVNLQTGANLDLSQKTTSDLAEGTNLYYTNARARSSAYAMISIF